MQMKKRNLMHELTEGFVALAKARDGKRMLRTHTVPIAPAPLEGIGPSTAAGTYRPRNPVKGGSSRKAPCKTRAGDGQK
jgi:hypothetical protein